MLLSTMQVLEDSILNFMNIQKMKSINWYEEYLIHDQLAGDQLERSLFVSQIRDRTDAETRTKFIFDSKYSFLCGN